ncbi:hypothetical protein [Telluribacter sp. SYSU D00476]|uniref:hypothetical protein n=1 Tax=Telluribacter sp. SYSU D00476 TaxID=2811430 RepID=UPI001FF1C8A4|nr:hypothetical protein [Telluribacter sp. SYSU D00476]
MRKYISVMALVLFVSAQVLAQQGSNLYDLPSPYERYTHYLATARVTAAVPIGAFADNYIDRSSAQNYSLSLEWILRSNLSVGGEVGKNFFQQRLPRQMYQLGEQEVSAVQTRTLTQYPIQGFVNYHFAGSGAMVRPYVHLSAGGSFVDYTLYWGNLADQQQKFAFTYGVGAGTKVLFKRDGSVGMDLRVKYTQTPYNYDYITSGISALNGSIGLFYRWW